MIRKLDRVARASADEHLRVHIAVDRLGGRVISGSLLSNSITAVLPRNALSRLARRSDIQAIAPAPRMRRLSTIAAASAASGAATWWSAGHTGGRGAADIPATLSVVQDPVYYAHPTFQGLTFETVPGQPAGPPNFTGNGHGTALLSMAASRGASGCAQCVAGDESQRGVAYGVGRVLDPDGAYSEFDWPLGITYGRYDNATSRFVYQAGASHPAQVLNYSRGGDVNHDDDLIAQAWDVRVDAYGVTAAVAAGNSGDDAQTVNTPAIAYNVLAVGAYCCSGSPDHTTDYVSAYSSRGPTASGRKKPDLVAPGDGQVADVLFQTTGDLFKFDSGTSYAAPAVAGAATLRAGAGIRDPKVVKVLLINSARQGRSGPGQPWGSQTGWQADFGWGELDLDRAYQERLNFVTGTVPANGARFFRATAQGAGERATLVWHRRVTDCVIRRQGCVNEPGSGWRAYTLTNLDLKAHTAAGGAQQSASTSAVDNVEQVRTTQAGDVIYKVSAGGIDGLAGEPFALAGARPLTPLATPEPGVALSTTADGPLRANQEVTVTATVANPSPDLEASGAQVALAVPAGVEIVGGAQTQSLGTLAKNGRAGSTATATWTVRGSTDGVKQLIATATASAYGSTLTRSGSATVTVDAAPPEVTIAAPPATTTDTRVPVTWGATDAGAGVAHYDVEVSIDGGPFAPWLSATTQTAAVYDATPGRRYTFRARAVDRFGNASGYVTAAEIAVAAPPGPTARRDTNLVLGSVKRRRTSLSIWGLVDRDATGTVVATWTAKIKRKRVVARRTTRVAGGRFGMRIRIPRSARSARRATLTLRYSGDVRYSPAQQRLALRHRTNRP